MDTRSLPATLLDINKIYSVVQRRTKGHGISISFDTHATTASTSKDQMILPELSLPITKDKLDLLYGYIVHECGHLIRSDVFKYMENSGLSTGHPLLYLFNMIEDQIMERKLASEHYGDSLVLCVSLYHHVLGQVERYAKQSDSFKDEDAIKSAASYRMSLLSREDWDDNLLRTLAALDSILPAQAIDLCQDLADEGWTKRLQEANTIEDSWKYSCDLYKRLYPNVPDEEIEQLKNETSASSKPQLKDENGNHPLEEDVTDTIKYSWKQLGASADHDRTGAPALIDWSDHVKGKRAYLIDDERITLMKYPPNQAKISVGAKYGNLSLIADKVRAYIQATKRNKISVNKYSGNLTKRDVTKLAFPPIDNGDWNKRIFFDTITQKYKSACITVLVDWSGSMAGTKMNMAQEAAINLVHLFDTVLHVPTSVYTFSSIEVGHAILGEIKTFNDSYKPAEMVHRFTKFYECCGGNADGDSIAWVFRHIVSPRKETKKIMIVLSDGAPTEGSMAVGADADTTLYHVVRELEALPNFSIIGIGIEHTGVTRYYKNHYVVKDISKLPQALLETTKAIYEGIKYGTRS